MNKLAIAAMALALAASGAARADSILVLNSEDASYSILSRSGRVELVRLPIGREPHHLMPTPDGKEVLVGSTATNELLVLDAKTGEKRRVVRDIIDPYQLGFSPDGKWFVTVAYRLDHVDIYHAEGFKLAGRIFIDGLPSHMTFDTDSKTVFVTLQQTGRVVASASYPTSKQAPYTARRSVRAAIMSINRFRWGHDRSGGIMENESEREPATGTNH